jgi:hypothetical protein
LQPAAGSAILSGLRLKTPPRMGRRAGLTANGEPIMSEPGSPATGRRDFLQTVLAAPALAAAFGEPAQAGQAARDLFVKHAYEEHTVNLGEVVMNYVVAGSPISDLQAAKVKEIVTAAGQPFEYVSLPDAAHAMHQVDPDRFAQVLTAWAMKLPA